ncbi:hypothetical protein V8E53_013176 [Lactarius tabidus]
MPVHCDFDITQRALNFPHPFVDRPRLAHGLREIDIANNANIRVSSTLHNITIRKNLPYKSNANRRKPVLKALRIANKGRTCLIRAADCNIITWGDTTLWSAVADVIAFAPADQDFLTGEHMRSLWRNPDSPASVRIDFERPFLTPPKVAVFFNCIELDRSRIWRLYTAATDIDTKGFTLHIETWLDTILYAARVGWIAYPENRGNILNLSVSTGLIHPAGRRGLRHSDELSFKALEMPSVPSVFIALNSLDIDCNAGLRINAYVDNISSNRLNWHIDSWNDTVVYSAGATLIAFT